MRTKRGEPGYTLRPFSHIIHAVLRFPDDIFSVLKQVTPESLAKAKSASIDPILGAPVYFVTTTPDKIEIWPVPDKPYKIKIRYLPPERDQ